VAELGPVHRAVRFDDRDPVRPHLDRGRPVDHVGGQLEPGEQAAEPGQRDAVQPEVQHVLRVGRGQQRHAQLGDGHLGAAGHGGGLGDRVVSHHDQHAAVSVGAAQVAVPERVGRPVQAGGLAVPDPDHAIAGLVGRRRGQLGTLHRVGAQFLVHRGPVHHPVRLEQWAPAPDLQVVSGQRRPLVAGDQRLRPAAGPLVQPVLVDRDPHQGLQSGQVERSFLELVTVR
jgi:hypothetical protein